jgi:3-phosphoshikimate 1-carboxyvinyltransferase
MQVKVIKSALSGQIQVPSSKSHTMRAILLASLADGESIIRDYLPSPDTWAMINACSSFGAQIMKSSEVLTIQGVNGCPKFQKPNLDAGNSGQVFRFIAAIAALADTDIIIDGDASIRQQRPIKPLLAALSQLGVKALQLTAQQAPILIKGPMQHGQVTLDGEDSQPVSALLMACAFLKGATEIKVNNPGETPWIELTLDWLRRLKIHFDFVSYSHYRLHGFAHIHGFNYQVPGDFSSFAFPLVAGIITQSPLTFKNLDRHDIQGDKKILDLVDKIGISLAYDESKRCLYLKPGQSFSGFTYDMNQMIDALPILTVLACYASSSSRLFNASIARLKESDRLATITQELRKMGAQIEEYPDELIIHPAPLKGASLDSHRDHRIAMALIVAGLGATGETVVNDIGCIEKSYPGFVMALQQLGARIG